MAVNLETNFPISLNQQLKTNLSNNRKFIVNNIQVHLCCKCSFFYVDLIVFLFLILRLSLYKLGVFVDLTLFVVTSLCWNSLIVKSIVLLGFLFTFKEYFKFSS
jgi:hypothetical protein